MDVPELKMVKRLSCFEDICASEHSNPEQTNLEKTLHALGKLSDFKLNHQKGLGRQLETDNISNLAIGS